MSNTHNGWTNRDTWNANLWLNNDEYLQNAGLKCKNEDEIALLFQQVFTHEHEGINISNVNWLEIYEGFQHEA